jgi:hypothetical protein
MNNLTLRIIKGFNNRRDIEVVDIWCYTITVLVKTVGFFDLLSSVSPWAFIKMSDNFLKESLSGNDIFVVMDCEKSIVPLYLIISNESCYRVFNIDSEEIDDDTFYKNVGYFPENLSPNKSEREVNFAMVNAERLDHLEKLMKD